MKSSRTPPSKRDIAISVYSDVYKDLYGRRPHDLAKFDEMSVDEIDEMIEDLHQDIDFDEPMDSEPRWRNENISIERSRIKEMVRKSIRKQLHEQHPDEMEHFGSEERLDKALSILDGLREDLLAHDPFDPVEDIDAAFVIKQAIDLLSGV